MLMAIFNLLDPVPFGFLKSIEQLSFFLENPAEQRLLHQIEPKHYFNYGETDLAPQTEVLMSV